MKTRGQLMVLAPQFSDLDISTGNSCLFVGVFLHRKWGLKMASVSVQHMFFCENGFRWHKFWCNRSKDSNDPTLHLKFFRKKAMLIFQCINLSVLNVIELRFK